MLAGEEGGEHNQNLLGTNKPKKSRFGLRVCSKKFLLQSKKGGKDQETIHTHYYLSNLI